MDIVLIATLITAGSTAILAAATFYYAYANHKLVLSSEKELKKPRKIDELNSIIKPLISDCNYEIKSLEVFPFWDTKSHKPFSEKIDQNNYKKMIVKNFISDNKELGKKIIWRDAGLKRFNDIFNELIGAIDTDVFRSDIKRKIDEFNWQSDIRINESNYDIPKICIYNILGKTDVNNKNLDGPIRSFWKRFRGDLLIYLEPKEIQNYLQRLSQMANDMKEEDKEIIRELEKLCDVYTKEYGISLEEELKDYL